MRRWSDALRAARPELVVGAVLVVGALTAGVVWGVRSPVTDCTTAWVNPLEVFAVNLALCLVLLTGTVTYGVSTFVAAVYVLAPTGAAIGSIAARFGGEGVALLAPHGVLEVAACVVAAAAGVQQPVARVHDRVRAGRGSPPADRPGLLGTAARALAVVAVLLLVAGVVESIWTGWYGQRVHC